MSLPNYAKVGTSFAWHAAVNHATEEYAHHDAGIGRLVTTNSAESYFGNTKRSMDGTHHHVNRKHLPLYMAELDYNTNRPNH